MNNKMSSFPKLNIDISDLSKPKKIKFLDIEPEPPPSIKVNTRLIVSIVGGIVAICIVVLTLSTHTHKLRPRRIIRLQCYMDQAVQTCTTSLSSGEFVISNCDAYEFNGIPSIDLLKVNGNYRLPVSNDLTLRVKDPCPDIVATIDTRVLSSYYREYTRIGALYTKRLVWITNSCYKSFTVHIGTEKIFDSTPSTMIDNVKMGNRTAYTYESPGVSGSIQISGHGCKYPIHIYSS